MDDLPRKKDKKPLYREVGAGWWQKLDPQTSCWFFAHEDGRVQWEAPEGIDHSRVLPQNLHSKTERSHHGSSRSSSAMPSESAMRACEACAGRHRPHTCGRARGNNHRGAAKAKAKASAKAKKRPAVPKSPIKRKAVADPVEGCEACAGRHRPHTCHRRTNRANDSENKSKIPKLEYTASFVLRGRIETVPGAPDSADDGAEGEEVPPPHVVMLSGTWFDSDNTDFATTEMRLFEGEDAGADDGDESCPPSGGVWLGAMAIPMRAEGAASGDDAAEPAPQMIQDRMALRFARAERGAEDAAAAADDGAPPDGAPPEVVVEGEGVTSAGRYVIHGRCAPDEANARAWVLEVTRTYTSDAPEPPPMPAAPDAAEFVEASMHAPAPLNKEDLYAGNDVFWRRQ